MEKRLVLALILSILVLYFWPGVGPIQRTTQKAANVMQPLAGNNVAQNKDASQLDRLGSSKDEHVKILEDVRRLESDKISVEFSNVGGVIKRVVLREYGFEFPLTNIGAVSGHETSNYSLNSFTDNEIVYLYADENVNIYKSYVVGDDYTVNVNTKIIKRTDAYRLDNIGADGFHIDMSNLEAGSAHEKELYGQERSLFEYVVSSSEGILRKNNAYKFFRKDDVRKDGDVNWVGFRGRYFCAIIKPLYKTSSYSIQRIANNKLAIDHFVGGIDGLSGDVVDLPSIMFFGPEESRLLQSYKMGFEDIKRYYKWTLFDSIAKIIYSIMGNINKVIPNLGLCIIIISVIVYFSMYPLTLRSMVSMKKMQALQPKIAVLREKYKENPQKMNMEMMELYKKHKINPLGGCLPMLLQMPVFIGLYQVLWRSVSLKGADFLWIKDLSAPDRFLILKNNFPFIGNEINILPVIMIFVMAFQQKLTSKNMVISDPAQLAQQRMMSVMMPIFLGYIFYKFSSGLTLYFTMFYLFSAITQWKMSLSKEVVA